MKHVAEDPLSSTKRRPGAAFPALPAPAGATKRTAAAIILIYGTGILPDQPVNRMKSQPHSYAAGSKAAQAFAVAVLSTFFLIVLPIVFAPGVEAGAGLYIGASPTTNRARFEKSDAKSELGARLFADDRFSSPNGDFRQSCSHCHMTDQDPEGVRVFTDFLPRSWVPWRSADPRRDGLRNAPTLLDVDQMPRLHLDGEFGSLEDLMKGTLSGRSLGWLPGEEAQAFNQTYRVIVAGKPGGQQPEDSYCDLFRTAYGVDPKTLTRDQVVDLVAKALSDFVRGFKSERSTPYDNFMHSNGLDQSPSEGESPVAYSGRLLKKIGELKSRKKLALNSKFTQTALAGLEIFLRCGQPAHSGSCVVCHVPPYFTDFRFHNMGVSQMEYDKAHEDGGFARLSIPDAATAMRPAEQFRQTASAQKPGDTDLGYWNFVRLDSRDRLPGETADAFLRRMIATFKTPTLRNLAYSQPYMHNGMYGSLEDTLAELMTASDLARKGRIRSGDEQLSEIRITDTDIGSLTAFLASLNQNLGKTRDADY